MDAKEAARRKWMRIAGRMVTYGAVAVWMWLSAIRSRNVFLIVAVWTIAALGIELGLYGKDKLGLRRGQTDYQEKYGAQLDTKYRNGSAGKNSSD